MKLRKKHRMLRVTSEKNRWLELVFAVVNLVQTLDSAIKAFQNIADLMIKFFRWVCDVLLRFM